MWFNHIYALNNIWVLTFIKMFALTPRDIQMKKRTLHIISGAYIKCLENTLTDLQERSQWKKTSSSNADISKKILLDLYYEKAYLQMNMSLDVANSDLQRVDRTVWTHSMNYEFLEVSEEKRKHILLYRKNKSIGETTDVTISLLC